MPSLRIAVDLNGIDLVQPRGPARYARRLVEEMRPLAGDHLLDVWEPGQREGAADVVLALGGRPRVSGRAPVVAAVYDLSHLLAPATLPLRDRVARGFRAAWLTRRAAHLLAPSRGVASALATYLRVGGGRLTWLPSVGPGWTRARRDEVAEELAACGIAAPYLLFAGTLSRRKNLGVLLDAWERLHPELGAGLERVFCGAGSAGASGRPPAAGTRWLGYVPDERLRRLLSGATAWVSPSRAEGCSMGVLEAMAVGAPPLVAAGTALAEVVGTAGVVISADDVDGWTAAMRAVATDTEARNRMAARGVQAARELRAADAAARCLAAAEAAAARG